MSTKFDGEKSIIPLMANELIKYIIVVADKSDKWTYKTLFLLLLLLLLLWGSKTPKKRTMMNVLELHN